MRCHTLVVRPHAVCKRMLGRRESAAFKIKTNHAKQVFDRFLLGPVVDCAFQEIRANDLLAGHDLLKERDKAGAAFAKNLIQLLGCHPALIGIEQIVVKGGALLIHEFDPLELHIANRREGGRKLREICALFCLQPVSVGFVVHFRELAVLLRGNIADLHVLAVQLLRKSPVIYIKLIAVIVKPAGCHKEIGVAVDLENLVGQIGLRLAGKFHTLGRAHRLHVELYNMGCMIKQPFLLKEFVQFFQHLFC